MSDRLQQSESFFVIYWRMVEPTQYILYFIAVSTHPEIKITISMYQDNVG